MKKNQVIELEPRERILEKTKKYEEFETARSPSPIFSGILPQNTIVRVITDHEP